MNVVNKKRGFTLPEVLIGISVLAIAILTATSLFVSITRGNKANMNDLKAYYLASEGIEAVRNIRDTHWFNNIKWTGDLSFNFWSTNGTGVDFSQNKTYIISRKLISSGNLGSTIQGDTAIDNNQKVSLLKASAPWIVSVIDKGNEKMLNTKLSQVNNQFIHADHNGGFSRSNLTEATPFSRYVEVGPLEGDKAGAIKVKSVVFWSENGDERDIVLETVLTDWKSGPK